MNPDINTKELNFIEMTDNIGLINNEVKSNGVSIKDTIPTNLGYLTSFLIIKPAI